ncbi:MAG: Mov34/MPN/PAD-1 family protein [Sphingomonadales bacterium]
MITIARRRLYEIEAAGENAYPCECCGLLVGRKLVDRARGWHIERVVASENLAAAERADRFEVDPRVQIRLQRELRGSGLSVIGVYHSHPDGQALPSAHDLAQANDPELVWLVTAVSKGRAIGTTAHVLDPNGGAFLEAELRIIGIGTGKTPKPSKNT